MERERFIGYNLFGLDLPMTHAIRDAKDFDPASFSMRGWGECLYTMLTDNAGIKPQSVGA